LLEGEGTFEVGGLGRMEIQVGESLKVPSVYIGLSGEVEIEIMNRGTFTNVRNRVDISKRLKSKYKRRRVIIFFKEVFFNRVFVFYARSQQNEPPFTLYFCMPNNSRLISLINYIL
jgi:hypothetical protein